MILGALFVMGLGMGGTMRPIMSAALATLTDHNITRGSTLMDITQQVASSIGFALFSVLLTNGLKDAAASPKSSDPTRIPSELAGAYADTFVVAVVLVAVCLVPAAFLPRRKVAPVDPAAMVGH